MIKEKRKYFNRCSFKIKPVLSKKEIDAIEDLGYEVIPLEFGDFGKVHGSYSHALQFLTIFYGLENNLKKINLFKSFIESMMARREAWQLWRAIFDSRGSDINGPYRWVELYQN